MKKAIKLIICVFALIIFTASCSNTQNEGAVRFKNEYEALNGLTTPDGEHVYKNIKINNTVPIKYVESGDVVSLLSAGSGIIYMGFPECPWCRTLIPYIFEAYKESKCGAVIYYYNGLADRDVLSLSEDGDIVVEDAGKPEYHDIVRGLYDYLPPYGGLGDESIHRIYFPTTVFIKDSEIMAVHLVTVEGQESGYDELTQEQSSELKSILVEKMESIK